MRAHATARRHRRAQTQPQRQRRGGELPRGTSRSKAPDIVQDVADEAGTPDNKSQEHGQGRAYLLMLTIDWPAPAEPVCGQHAHADDNKILFKIKKAHRMPMAVAF